MAKKKNYNPFKMWGSYVGAVILGFGSSSSGLDFRLGSPTWWIDLLVWFGVTIPTGLEINAMNLAKYVLPAIIVGFLVGWGIHSLFRRYN